MDKLFKLFHADIKASSDSRTIKFLISTDSIDRDGDVMDPKGWDTTAYMKNPVVLWSHDYSGLPIAKAVAMETVEHGLAATAEFPAKGIHPFADTVYELLKGGFIGAASVGFKPIAQEKATDREKGFNYSRQELLEFSVVPIPANPEALVQLSVSQPECKVLVKALVDWSEKFLGEYYGERGVWLPAAQVEKTFEAINKAGVFATPVTKPMPMPEPDEKENEFLSRCMGDAHMNEKFPEEAQRAAVCHSQLGKNSLPVPRQVKSDEPYVVELSDEVYDVSLDELRAAMRAMWKQIVSESAVAAVLQAVNYARGRVT